MTNGTNGKRSLFRKGQDGITGITVGGFKSISREQSIEIRPLTVLAGANSSGKSSMMQPLLLLKQTLDAPYDPGPLRLNGPNVRFTSADQFFSYISKGRRADAFHIGVETLHSGNLTTYFSDHGDEGIEIQKTVYRGHGQSFDLRLGMPHGEAIKAIPPLFSQMIAGPDADRVLEAEVVSRRCFLEVRLSARDVSRMPFTEIQLPATFSLFSEIEQFISGLIHVPGLRGSLERGYPVTIAGPTFPGTFEYYVGGVIAKWQAENDAEKLDLLNKDLAALSLNGNVQAQRTNGAGINLRVGRLASKGRSTDLVDIADVGVGVSQALPVLIALHVAKPGQLVYIDQPELHLHPRAQSAMAGVLASAANRGVRVVVETHSSLLLLGIQTLVAEGQLAPDKAKLHWFEQSKSGTTKVASTDLDAAGTFGDWPQDFGEVERDTDIRYLNAAEAHLSQS